MSRSPRDPHKVSGRWLCWWLLLAFWLLCLGLLACKCAHAQERDYGRTCLALVGYSEARSDGYAGMVAAERVVMNRLYTRRFGGTICEVVFAPGQFEGIQRWKVPRIARELPQWLEALRAADAVIDNRVYGLPPQCFFALYFSQNKYTGSLCKVRNHWFRYE